VDARGAEHLVRAIRQQQHWRLAPAVRDGRQPHRDPHVSQLVEFADAVRRYLSPDGVPFEKRLSGDVWN
jgi:hypothetical protein